MRLPQLKNIFVFVNYVHVCVCVGGYALMRAEA